MLEFLLLLPILLTLLLALVEGGRLLEAWISLQSAARTGISYAVSGKYDPIYCAKAAATLGLPYAEADLGDKQLDCSVPDSYEIPQAVMRPQTGETLTSVKMSENLRNQARLESIRSAASPGVHLLQLKTPLKEEAGWGEAGYFRVTVCPDPNPGKNLAGDEYDLYRAPREGSVENGRCIPGESAGDTEHPFITVAVDYYHPLLTPFIPSIQPVIHLSVHRNGSLVGL